MNRQTVIVLLFLACCILIAIIQCSDANPQDARGKQYAGSETCVKCHRTIVENYGQDAHFHTSKPIGSLGDLEDFVLPEDTFVFNENTKVGVEKRPNGFYQVAYVNGEALKAEKIDMVFGAGKSAYTFAFWYGNKLMQQPLNYLVKQHEWVNSPGFPTDQIYFGRPIIAKCLECHSSFIDKRIISKGSLQMEEEFIKNSLIAGVDCERCHGPAAAHVAFHEVYPDEKTPHEIASFKALSRRQKVDMCGVCHSGSNLQALTSNFFFKPGDTIRNLPEFSSFRGEDTDVHGKQKQLMEASKCYQLSNMDCQSCHDIHGEENLSLAVYSQKCIKCHSAVAHNSLQPEQVEMASKNCIDCHMPSKNSKIIGFQMSNSKEKIPYQVRTHRIAVYRE